VTWQNASFLWLLLLIPVTFGFLWWWGWRLKKIRRQYFDDSLFDTLRRNYWEIGDKIKQVALYTGLAFLIVGLAGPKIGTEVREVKRKGVDLMVALDLSDSMNARDVSPSRLAKAKYEIQRLLRELNGDRVGLIIFTGEAFLQSPMTLDYSALRMFLDIAGTEQMPSSTTNFSAAMDMALESFKTDKIQQSNAAKVLLIMSDGENHGASYEEELNNLVENNVSVYTVGLGTRDGARIPMLNDQGQVRGYKRNKQGGMITTRLESKTLQNIAQTGNGEYYQITGGGSGISPFLGRINELQKGEFASQKYADYKNQYQWLVGIGLFFVLVWFTFPRSK
jgi:Ca-activated chloride channel family protein